MAGTDGRRDLGFSEAVMAKIVEPEALREAVGAFPRTERVVMCHGTFDLVHPGHLRHLAFAKSKGSTLVVSITTGLTPKNGRVAEPGLVGVTPGNGVIRMPPVSVCHQVSTIVQRPSPQTS